MVGRQRSENMRSILGLAAAFFVTAAGAAGAATIELDTFDKFYDARPGTQFSLENANGRVTIHGTNEPRIHVHAIKSVEAPRAEAAKEAMKELRIEVTQSNGGLSVATRYPK